MQSAIHAIILGAIEGITEFLPISSTGHMILAAQAMHLTETDFLKSFEIFIQLGAILAVFVLYWKKLLLNAKIFKRVLVAFIPTAVIGLVFYRLVKTYLLGNVSVVLWSLALGGILLVIFEMTRGERESQIQDIESLSYGKAALIGAFQSIAIIPGVSRSAATIVGGLLLGVSRMAIVEFSFLLAIPTMAAATGLDLIKSAHLFNGMQVSLLALGFISAFVCALLSVKLLLRYVKTHTFTPFGIYRIVLAALFLVFV